MMKEYLNRPEATKDAIVNGWYRTGEHQSFASNFYEVTWNFHFSRYFRFLVLFYSFTDFPDFLSICTNSTGHCAFIVPKYL